MSFCLREKTDDLEDACREATKRRIAMLCSAHDGCINSTHAYPTAFFGTIPIMACNESGMVLAGNKKLGNEFAVNAPVEILSVLNCNDNVSQSSLATAVAAGLSSLSLSCHQLAHMEEESIEQKGQSMLARYYLKKMAGDESNFVQPERFARIDRYINEKIDIQAILQTFFRD